MKVSYSQYFLLMSAIILIPIGLTYGAIPEGSMRMIYGLEIETPDASLVHMLRGLAGLYCGMGIFWIAGALKRPLTTPALWSVFVLMLGVAVGRIFSFVVDGVPTFWGFSFFCVSEILLASIAIYFIKFTPTAGSVAAR